MAVTNTESPFVDFMILSRDGDVHVRCRVVFCDIFYWGCEF